MTPTARITTPTAAGPRRPTGTPPPYAPLPWRATHEAYLAHLVAAPRPPVRLLRSEAASRVADRPRPGGQGGPCPVPDGEAHRRAAGSHRGVRAHRAVRESFWLRREVERG